MKIDSFISLIKDLRTNAITDDEDPSNTLLQEYTSPYDQIAYAETMRISKPKPSQCVWGDGTSFTAYDSNGNPYQSASCGWTWGNGGAWN